MIVAGTRSYDQALGLCVTTRLKVGRDTLSTHVEKRKEHGNLGRGLSGSWLFHVMPIAKQLAPNKKLGESGGWSVHLQRPRARTFQKVGTFLKATHSTYLLKSQTVNIQVPPTSIPHPDASTS